MTKRRPIPLQALQASLGCGNPTALAELKPGETVLDLGSGGGIDVLLSAQRVGPTGFAYGLDMTDEMLALADQNKAAAGAENVQFLKGHIEEIPLPDASVDVVISNCVINLAADKGQVLREAYRVLKPGGRFAVSDVVAQGEVPDDLRADMEAWVGCVAGALEEGEYRQLLADAGFGDVTLEVTRVYDPKELAESTGSGASCCGGDCCGSAGGVGSLGLRPLRGLRRPPDQRLRACPETVTSRQAVASFPADRRLSNRSTIFRRSSIEHRHCSMDYAIWL